MKSKTAGMTADSIVQTTTVEPPGNRFIIAGAIIIMVLAILVGSTALFFSPIAPDSQAHETLPEVVPPGSETISSISAGKYTLARDKNHPEQTQTAARMSPVSFKIVKEFILADNTCLDKPIPLALPPFETLHVIQEITIDSTSQDGLVTVNGHLSLWEGEGRYCILSLEVSSRQAEDIYSGGVSNKHYEKMLLEATWGASNQATGNRSDILMINK